MVDWEKTGDLSGKRQSDRERRGNLIHRLRQSRLLQRRNDEHAAGELQAITQLSETAILSITLEGRITSWNEGATRIYGYSAKEMSGESAFQLVPLGRGRELQERLKLVAKGVYLRSFETEHLKKDGSRLDVALSIYPVLSKEGEVLSAAWISFDISEKKRTETRLRELSNVVEQTTDGVMITNREGVISYVNRGFERMTGYSSAEVVGRKPNFLKSGMHDAAFYAQMWTELLAGRAYSNLLVSRRKDGSLIYTQKTITPLMDESGEITHFVSTDKDVTERRQAEERFQALARKYQDIFHYSSDAIAYCRPDGSFMDVNEAFSALTGYSRTELLQGRTYQDISSEEDWKLGNRKLQEIRHTGTASSYEKAYVRKDGMSVPVIVTAFPLKEGDTDAVTAIGVIVKDISEIKHQERQLQAMTEELRRSNAELKEFASVASHDLQEPLRTIALHLEVVEGRAAGSLDSDSLVSLKFATNAAKRLKALIGDVLAYANVGTTRNRGEIVDCNEVWEQVVEQLASTIGSTQARVEAGPLPQVFGSRHALAGLFQNLLSNSLKYQRADKIPEVKINAKDGGEEWIFSLSDNGIGIPTAGRERLFSMFARFHPAGQYEGTGIGLATCKKIVELNGGKIWVESSTDKGTTFHWTWPKLKASKLH